MYLQMLHCKDKYDTNCLVSVVTWVMGTAGTLGPLIITVSSILSRGSLISVSMTTDSTLGDGLKSPNYFDITILL